jgi:superfamily II DNA or RNA helicase
MQPHTTLASDRATAAVPSPGQVVRVRSRTWLVEPSDPAVTGEGVVNLSCLDDDAQGRELSVVWDLELDRQIVDEEAWRDIGKRGFDQARQFAAYLHTLRWHCVTATDPKLFQAPFRAGIRIDAYQLEPLAKALKLPRVNIFIADDVGLGKTIEAGLIASELLLRRRVRDIVVACPPSMLQQWREELESRFGLTFEIFDRAYVQRVREEHGYAVNPWTTFPRFLISHKLLIDDDYIIPMRAWLDNLRPGSLLILDEAHHAAPSTGSLLAIDSRTTIAIRDLAGRFEHRVFLSATPHNGHSNSFSSLLAILDNHRFTRGVPADRKNRDEVMVRRLKEDIRAVAGGFPERKVVQIDIDHLPEDAPELVLSRLLDEYRELRIRLASGLSKRQQAHAKLLISGLQQRLLSSIEAFSRTLAVHRRTVQRMRAEGKIAAPLFPAPSRRDVKVITGEVDADDELAELPEEQLGQIEDTAIETTTKETLGDQAGDDDARREAELLDAMDRVANINRSRPDARLRALLEWMRTHMCRGIRVPGLAHDEQATAWSDLRIIIFTEWEDTRRYIVQTLNAAIEGTDRWDERIEVFHGPTSAKQRTLIKRAFNARPNEHPVRILVATDAAREGLNLQAHCWNLFHFDVPWNPSRLEQRNGRIDRKLQPSPAVYCHYFFHVQRPEDMVLQALVRKTKTIRAELGSASKVLDSRLASMVREGIRHADAAEIARRIDGTTLDTAQAEIIKAEFEEARGRQDVIRRQIDELRTRINKARQWIGLDQDSFRDALSCSLEMLGADALKVETDANGQSRYAFPNLAARRGADPSWAATLDTLRAPAREDEPLYQWRREYPIRPVVFDPPDTVDDDVVQLHLEHRVVQRLLGRFLAQGFVHHDLSRACLAQCTDAIPRVVLIGRLSLYGSGAVRLHEELITVTARWTSPRSRRGGLTPYGRDAEAKTMELLEASLKPGAGGKVPDHAAAELLASLPDDIQQLLPHLQDRGDAARADAEAMLAERGLIESQEMRRILEAQAKRIQEHQKKHASDQMLFSEQERRQLDLERRDQQRFLDNVRGDLEREPARITNFYKVASARIEPVGIAYLWPVTG